MKKLLQILLVISAIWSLKLEAALELKIHMERYQRSDQIEVEEEVLNPQGGFNILKWKIVHTWIAERKSPTQPELGFNYLSYARVQREVYDLHGNLVQPSFTTQEIVDISPFVIDDTIADFDGVCSPVNQTANPAIANPAQTLAAFVSRLWIYNCPWEDPDGVKNRAIYGDWDTKATYMSYKHTQRTPMELHVTNWDERDLTLPNTVTIHLLGQQYDTKWDWEFCFSNWYQSQVIVNIQGDGIYAIPQHPPANLFLPCTGSPSDRDHTITVYNPKQTGS